MADGTSTSGPPAAAAAPRFSSVRALGSGSKCGAFMQVALDNKANGQAVAIKYMPRSKLAERQEQVLREVLIHHQLSLSDYPHITQFKEVFVTPRYLGIMMEHVDGADLQAYLVKQGGSLSVDVARFLFQQLVLAVDYIHKRGKVHRDLRLSNILIVDSGVMPLLKIRNFGLAKDTNADRPPRGQVGAALFTAPEVVLNVSGHPYDGELVDAWSCGVILFMMLYGHHPFLSHADMELGEAEQVVRLIENEVKGQLHFPQGAEPSVCDLLRRILVPAPAQRFTISSIMSHAWFQKKLPPGALDLNSSYLQATSYHGVRQTTTAIKQLIQAAAQVPQDQAPAPPTPAPAPAPAPAAAPAPPALQWPQELMMQLHRKEDDAAAAAAAVLMDISRPGQQPAMAWPAIPMLQLLGRPVSLQQAPATIITLDQAAAMRVFALSADHLPVSRQH